MVLDVVINTLMFRGLVEKWLTILEEYMVKKIINIIKLGMKEIQELTTEEFVIDRAAQSVLTAIMVMWTYECEEILNNDIAQLESYYNQCKEYITKIVELIKTNISQLNRLTLEALIVLQVHNREIVMNLMKSNIQGIEDFSYQAQLRYYFLSD